MSKSIAPGRTDWSAVFRWGDEAEDGPPRAPKRAGSNVTGSGDILDTWWLKCGHVVSASDPILSTRSTEWTRYLARITHEAARAEGQEELRCVTNYYREQLDFLSKRLGETPTGKLLHKRRKTAEMNARYVAKGGKRVYIGKKAAEDKKRRRADAAYQRREGIRATTHGAISDTDDMFWYENQCKLACAEIQHRLRR